MFRNAGLGVLSLLSTLGFFELSMRSLDIQPIADIKTSHYVLTCLWPQISKPLPFPDISRVADKLSYPRALKPNIRISRSSATGQHNFTTLASAVNPAIGYRSNGDLSDQEPVYGVAVGDSMTEGAYVDDRETYVSVLSGLSKKRFVNLGVFGQGTTGDLARLKLSGFMELKPKVIILEINPSDLREDLSLEIRERPYAGGVFSMLHYRLMRWSLGYYFAVRLVRRWPRSDPHIERLAAGRFAAKIQRKNLSRAYALARRYHAKLLIVEDGTNMRRDFQWPPDGLESLLIVAPGVGGTQRIAYDGHWNREGNRTVAQAIFKCLRENHWL